MSWKDDRTAGNLLGLAVLEAGLRENRSDESEELVAEMLEGATHAELRWAVTTLAGLARGRVGDTERIRKLRLLVVQPRPYDEEE